jgi:hypothetical protein
MALNVHMHKAWVKVVPVGDGIDLGSLAFPIRHFGQVMAGWINCGEHELVM